MKRLLGFVTLVVTVFALTGCSQEQIKEKATEVKEEVVQADFGDTIEEVIKLKGEPLFSMDNRIFYTEEFAGYKAEMLYAFNKKDELYSYMISFSDSYETKEEYEERYKVLKIAMIAVNGEPTTSIETDEKNTLMWKGEDRKTEILLGMNYTPAKKDTVILYSNKEYR